MRRQYREALVEVAIHLSTLGVGLLVWWLDESEWAWDLLAELLVR